MGCVGGTGEGCATGTLPLETVTDGLLRLVIVPIKRITTSANPPTHFRMPERSGGLVDRLVLGLLKRLDQPVQKNPIKTTIAKFDAILMMRLTLKVVE